MKQDNYYRLKKAYKYGSQVIYSPSVMILKEKTQPQFVFSPKLLLEKTVLSLYVNAYEGEHLQVLVRNSYNKVVYRTTYEVLVREVTFSLGLESLGTGMYQIELISSKGTYQDWIWVQ